METPAAPQSPLRTMNWNTAVDRLFHAFMTSDASSTSKWNKSDPLLAMITNTTGLLFAEDYDYEVIDNEEGQICATYPLKMYFLKGSKGGATVQQSTALLEPLQHGARFGRVRTRYPMPVILFRGRNICRSSSLTRRLEALVQTTHNSIRDTLTYSDSNGTQTSPEQQATTVGSDSAEMMELLQTLQSDQTTAMDKHRLADITLIRTLRVTHIADLMLENYKKIMGVSVCSSEKNDSYKRYADFKLLVLPYPGVEFFRYFSPLEPEMATGLHFDWTSWPAVNRPPGSISYDHDTITSWDSITLSKNYLKTMLYCLCDPSCSGLLVHCVCGWDRTPLFVSLLRLSLWADGEIHSSLTPEQILYLTVSYDWMLFRHQLVVRQTHAEDIFAFCFYFLEHITGPEFSIDTIMSRIGTSGSAATCIPAPAPSFKPTLLSYVSDLDAAPSSATNSPALAPSSQAYAAIKAKQTPTNSRRTKPKVEEEIDATELDSKKSILDGLIISSYRGNSSLEQHMQQLGSIEGEESVIRRSTDLDSDDEFLDCSHSSISDDSISGSFQPLAFGIQEPPALPETHTADSFSPSSFGDDEPTITHPLDPSLPTSTPLSDSHMQDARNASRKQRLLAVFDLFKIHYFASMQPYFLEKRKNSSNGIWNWLPSFSLGRNSEPTKRN